MTEQIENLRKMIEDAKRENDEVLIEYLSKALNHLLKKQKESEDIKLKSQENVNQEENQTQEVKQEVQIEEKKDEIEKTKTTGLSTITKFKSGNIRLESKYMDAKVQSSNSKLKINLESLLVTLALDEISNEQNFVDKYIDLLRTAKEEQDIKDMVNFLQTISSVGDLGAKYSNALTPITQKYLQEINKKPETRDISNNLKEVNKQIELLDMRLDEIKNGKGIDPEDLYALAKRYESQIEDLEDLYKNNIDRDKKIELEIKLDSLRKKVKDIRAYASQIEDLSQYQF